MWHLAFLGSPGGGEMLIILLAVLLLFGARRLPEMARTLGRMLGEIQRASNTFKHELMENASELRRDLPREPLPGKPIETPLASLSSIVPTSLPAPARSATLSVAGGAIVSRGGLQAGRRVGTTADPLPPSPATQQPMPNVQQPIPQGLVLRSPPDGGPLRRVAAGQAPNAQPPTDRG